MVNKLLELICLQLHYICNMESEEYTHLLNFLSHSEVLKKYPLNNNDLFDTSLREMFLPNENDSTSDNEIHVVEREIPVTPSPPSKRRRVDKMNKDNSIYQYYC